MCRVGGCFLRPRLWPGCEGDIPRSAGLVGPAGIVDVRRRAAQPEPPDNGVPNDERSSCHHTPPACRPAPAMDVPGRCRPYTWRCGSSRLFTAAWGAIPRPGSGGCLQQETRARPVSMPRIGRADMPKQAGKVKRERRQLRRLGGDNALQVVCTVVIAFARHCDDLGIGRIQAPSSLPLGITEDGKEHRLA